MKHDTKKKKVFCTLKSGDEKEKERKKTHAEMIKRVQVETFVHVQNKQTGCHEVENKDG